MIAGCDLSLLFNERRILLDDNGVFFQHQSFQCVEVQSRSGSVSPMQQASRAAKCHHRWDNSGHFSSALGYFLTPTAPACASAAASANLCLPAASITALVLEPQCR